MTYDELSEIDSEIHSLKDQISELESQISQLEEQIECLKIKLSLEQTLAEFDRKRISELETDNIKLVFMLDSLFPEQKP